MTTEPTPRRGLAGVWGFLIIALAMAITHVGWMRHGMCWNEPSWLFHFGHRTASGAVPYRDYVFPDGPLPIYVDAGMQTLFGGKYIVSLFAGLLIETLRVFVVWSIVRRLAGNWPAALVAVFCGLDPIFAFAHHWTTPYAQLFGTLAGLALLVASRRPGPSYGLLALAGLCVGLIVSARTDVALSTGALLLVATTVMTLRKNYFTPRRYAALWAGCAAAYLVVGGLLGMAGALGDAIQQTVISASDITGVGGVGALVDGLTGGSASAVDHAWWAGLIIFLGLPALVVALAVAASRGTREVPLAVVGLLVAPVGVVLAVSTRSFGLYFLSDVPRTFFMLTTALAVLWPDRLRAWFGVEPLVALGLGGLALASDWALETTFPGRGWGDSSSLVIAAVMISLASTYLSRRIKVVLAAVLAVSGVIHVAISVHDHVSPVARAEATDGTLKETGKRSPEAPLRGLGLSKARLQSLAWFEDKIPRGSTCFIYGNLPALYTLLHCRNPTRLDVTSVHFASPRAASEAIAQLKRSPPDYLISHESQWMSPPIWKDLGGDPAKYEGINRESQRILHVGMRELAIGQYTSIGLLRDALGPELADRADAQWDKVDMVIVYRRKGVPPPEAH